MTDVHYFDSARFEYSNMAPCGRKIFETTGVFSSQWENVTCLKCLAMRCGNSEHLELLEQLEQRQKTVEAFGERVKRAEEERDKAEKLATLYLTQLTGASTVLEQWKTRAETSEKRVAEIEDIELARLQFPDGSVPGNTVECARGWKKWADYYRKCYNNYRDAAGHLPAIDDVKREFRNAQKLADEGFDKVME